ncbi:MAG: DUF4255 domain-containing protein [Bacteroidota bacterium]
MILQTLRILADELNAHLGLLETLTEDLVVLGNIATLDNEQYSPSSTNSSLLNKIVVSLVKVEEEKTMKNRPAHRINPLDNSLVYENPNINVNLYILISINSNYYENALTYLSRIIRFYQSKRVFTHLNTPITPVGNDFDQVSQFKFIMDMVSPTFEESNYLWSINGGKQMPYVLYKVRMLELEFRKPLDRGALIEEVQIQGKSKL